MAFFPEQDAETIGRQAENFWRVPLGAVSPLWAIYGAAATGGVAFWWMSQWTQKWGRPVNLEAFSYPVPMVPETTTAPAVAQTLAALQPEPVAPLADPAVDPDDPAAQLAEAGAEAVGDAAEAVGEAAMATSLAADDLTRLVGIGPTLATKLADLGVRTFADIASWTDEDLEKVDKALDLKGRAAREAWVDQARQFAQQ
jgi:predicted flap endonuclease-1-like 5' DNA nuclease